jgi:hypothetical protein
MQRKGRVLEAILESQAGVYPCVLFTRTQEGGKTRNIWGYPASDTVVEQTVLGPYLAFEKSQPHRAALNGPDAVDVAMSYLLSRKQEGHVVYCVDFAAFDASVSPELSVAAFSRIASEFQSPYQSTIADIADRFTSIGVFTPDGEYDGRHGVPSGSAFTNTVDTLAQWFASGLNEHCQVQGDDGVYLVPNGDVATFEERFQQYGFSLNVEKSHLFDTAEAIYLQRYFSIDRGYTGGVYPLHRAMERIKYLERWTDFEREGITGNDFFAIRTIMILENCKHHPGFRDFVNYVRSLWKEGLNFTRQGVVAYSKMLESRVRAGVYSGQISEGINSFETVKILKSG